MQPLRPNLPLTPLHRDLLSHLEAGSTGCLHATLADGTAISVYVMLGEILAAHAADDRERLLTLLQNTGAAEAEVIDRRRRFPTEVSLTEELFELVPEEALQELLTERFRENLFRFLQAAPPVRFEELESIFVENIQVGHESRPLLEELEGIIQSTARLRRPPGLVLCPGGGTLKDPNTRRLVALCNPRLPLADLLQRSPFEFGRTLALVSEMLERGALVPVSPRENEGQTDKPVPRPAPPAAKVAVAAGRPDPLSRDPFRRAVTRSEEPKEAVASALASAVSAAVAKVGRQRTADPVAPAPQGSPVSPFDPISAATPKPAPRPVAVAVAPPAPSPAAEAPAPPPVRRPPPPVEEPDDELAAFQDYDYERQGGEFITAIEHLDRVEVVSVDEVPVPRRAQPPAPVEAAPITIEMEDAENATSSELAGAVSLNFAGPKLGEEDARRKVEVVNEVLKQLVIGLDAAKGPGVGQSRAQLVIEGTPGAYSALFKGVEVDASGRLSVDTVMKNLRKRPASEHRRLLNRGMQDVIERALSVASEELDDAELETMLEAVAGYQQRLGV